MKQQTVVILDDIDGSEGADTYAFSFNGVNYEIDLKEENAEKLVADFEKWIQHSRKVVRARTRQGSVIRTGLSAEMRQWLSDNGFDVPTRGRISSQLAEEYYQAFPNKRP